VLRCHRYLTQTWEYSLAKIAEAEELDAQDGEGAGEGEERDMTEHLRRKLLTEWCPRAVQRMTADMESLEMHSAVRNVMRLFERIKDFEKRVRAREPRLRRASREALVEALALHAQLLAPFAPHLAEELWVAFGRGEIGTQMPWPGVSFGVPA
jgi:leucyl-tRNA synthetase